MPIYEYNCSKCKESFAVLKWITEEEEKTACPNCGSTELKRIISSFSCSSAADSDSSTGDSYSGFSGGG